MAIQMKHPLCPVCKQEMTDTQYLIAFWQNNRHEFKHKVCPVPEVKQPLDYVKEDTDGRT